MEREYSQKYLQLNRDKRIVFDARDLPFFRVRPDLSDLGISPKLEAKLQQDFPQLRFNRGCIVDGAVLIADVLAFTPDFNADLGTAVYNLATELNTTSAITLQVVDGALVNDFLLRNLILPTFRATKPTIIFPGEGARIVSEYMKRQEPAIYDMYDMERAIYLPCERTMLAKGKFDLVVDYSALPENLKTQAVVIIDDVIASGQTMQTIAQEVRSRYPNTNIIAASWFLVEPTQKEIPSGIPGVDLTIASFVLRGNYTARPPINSLSCFIRDREKPKYMQVKTAFVEKYIDAKDRFQRLMEEIKP